eukprot:614914-Prymnesium_polylepis.1
MPPRSAPGRPTTRWAGASRSSETATRTTHRTRQRRSPRRLLSSREPNTSRASQTVRRARGGAAPWYSKAWKTAFEESSAAKGHAPHQPPILEDISQRPVRAAKHVAETSALEIQRLFHAKRFMREYDSRMATGELPTKANPYAEPGS